MMDWKSSSSSSPSNGGWRGRQTRHWVRRRSWVRWQLTASGLFCETWQDTEVTKSARWAAQQKQLWVSHLYMKSYRYLISGSVLFMGGKCIYHFDYGLVIHDPWSIFSKKNLLMNCCLETGNRKMYSSLTVSQYFTCQSRSCFLWLLVPRSHVV